MTRHLLAVLLFAGCATSPTHYQQAAAVRPVPRPPALTPGYSPNTYEPPPYAPAGAGASHGGIVTTPEGRTVPRSPNTRILPPTSDPGLWAADGAPMAGEEAPAIFGVVLPLPQHPPLGAKEIANDCSSTMASLMRSTRSERLVSAPEPSRACMAARAYLRCVQREGAASSAPARVRPGPPPLWTPRTVKLTVQPLAERIVKLLCTDVKLDGDDEAALTRLLEKYTWGPRDLTME